MQGSSCSLAKSKSVRSKTTLKLEPDAAGGKQSPPRTKMHHYQVRISPTWISTLLAGSFGTWTTNAVQFSLLKVKAK